jgi:hypothetical protein
VESDNAACTGQDVEFTATTSPGGGEDCVSWSGGQSPATGTGATFTTSWSSVGTKTVTATCGTSTRNKTVEIINTLTVVPAEAYVGVDMLRDFEAWTCDAGTGTAENVTADATFSTSNGEMHKPGSGTEGPGNYRLFPSSPSPTVGFDRVTATCDGISTEDTGGDCTLTVIKVEITAEREWVMLSAQDDGITSTLEASAAPSGGTYDWDTDETGAGAVTLEYLAVDEVKVKPSAPSSDPGDVEVYVLYYFGDPSDGASKGVDMTVRKPTSTTCTAGQLKNASGSPIWRYFYHKIKDQLGDVIDETGIDCSEVVVVDPSSNCEPKTSPGSTQSWAADTPWTGGIALRDKLQCPVTTMGDCLSHQTIKAEGYATSPYYFIHMEPMEMSGQRIWKEATSNPSPW